MDSNSNLENDKARMELIDRLVQKASSKQSSSNKDDFYRNQLPKVGNFNLEDCIEQALRENKAINPSNQGDNPVLRTFETIDFDALTKGFEPEEIKEGKLVLYITENQLLQLLKQRAIVVPNKSSLNEISRKNFSLVDDKIGSRFSGRAGPSQVELVVNQNQQDQYKAPLLSKISETNEERTTSNNSQKQYNQLSNESNVYETYQEYKTQTSDQIGSVLYEENFDHVRTISQFSGDNIRPYPTSASGLQGSIYVGDNNQTSAIDEVLKAASKATNNNLNYHTTVLKENHLKTASLSNFNTNEYLSPLAKNYDYENEAINQLDKLGIRLTNSLRDDRIDWSQVQEGYRTIEELNKADIMKAYVSSLIEDNKIKSNEMNKKLNQEFEKLTLLDTFVNKATGIDQSIQKYEENSRSVSIIKDLIEEIKKNARSRAVNTEFRTGHKIIIKTTRILPPKIISQSVTNVTDCNSRSSINSDKKNKKRISFTNFSDNSKTRVYELGAENNVKKSSSQSADVFNSKQNVNYSIQAFEPLIDNNLGKPSFDKVNKYLSVINTGIRNTDLIQIHPLLNNKTEITSKAPSGKANPTPSVKKAVIIDSDNYLDQVSKHFGGLKVTDFPLYVQGLEIKQNKGSSTKLASGIQKSESLIKKTVQNNNQFVKVQSAVPAQ